LYTVESQGEIDVVGLNIAEQQVYICEVAVHLTTGLQYVRDNRPNNVQKLTDKFSRDIEYARKYLDEYNQHFMLWSPIVKDTQGNPENNQTRHLEEIKANIQKQYSIEIEFIVNERFQKCLVELRNYARAETKNIQCPLVRLMQIEEYLDKHVKKLTHMQGHESTPILTDKRNEKMDGSVPATVTVPGTEFSYTGPEMKALRLKAGLTQGDVAVALGMKCSSSAAIGDWEAERVKVPAKHHATLLSLYEPGKIYEDETLLKNGTRGEYAKQYAAGTNIVRLEPDVAAAFSTEEAVNEALRFVLKKKDKEE
jgi:transcriptional regulator with XRE-family HTH domain